ncbi:glycerol-3-phosphate dehydrogenase [Dongshaea marina]|uniref:glycerol-3-phosphate dehydrogenase n=1 Tax=Dongshaea marina TaxID=2047966 RepID=UPI000D3EB62B|nr:glycerol-3-phosphate dehydrogenase [Dongshaea marina]
MSEQVYDLVIVGGGVNGTGIAADAAGRGLTVALFEADDLASATSSASSKLIHGGLRYLEHYEFRLVKEALAERETILKMAPHIVSPMRFRLPHRPHLRPAWMIRAGLFLYDNLAKRVTLPGSCTLKFGPDSALKPEIRRGFEYSDGWVDDARLVTLNAMQAREKGGEIYTRTKVTRATRHKGLWQIEVTDSLTGESREVLSRGLVNAAGPWVKSFFDESLTENSPRNIRLVKGSHIIVPRIHDEPQAYILQNDDQRIVFVIPYLQQFSLIGTTDVEYQGDPRKVAIDEDETQYLIRVVNDHFKQQISTDDVIASYSGVRPLCDDESSSAQAVTRDYTMELSDACGKAPLLSVFGGKLTTYRKLGQAALNKLKPYYPHAGGDWTANCALPGGDIESAASLEQGLKQEYPWLEADLRRRLAHSYGSLSRQMLGQARSFKELGEHYGCGLTERELEYLIKHEWVVSADDVLRRRSKLYLFMTGQQRQHLAKVMEQKLPEILSERFQSASSATKELTIPEVVNG